MRKTGWKGGLVVLGVGWCCWPSVADAARESGPSAGSVLVNPVGILYGPLIAEFGFGLGSNASLNLHGSRWDHLESTLPGDLGAWGLGAGAQLFPTGPIYGGLFAYPSVEWLWLSLAQRPSDSTAGEPPLALSALVPKLIFGYQFDWKTVTLRLGLGGYYVAQLTQNDEPSAGLDGLRLAIDLSFGLTF